MKVAVVLVDRANYGRLWPVMREMQNNPRIELQVVCAGTMLLERFGKAERVVLRFTPLQGKYMLALPLHASQRVLRNDAEDCVVELCVMPNIELRQELLSLGSAVEVLEPESLAEAIREEHRKAGG